MPAALSIVSVDAYDQNKMDIDSTKSIYEQYVFPRCAHDGPLFRFDAFKSANGIVGAGSRRIRAGG